MGAFIASQADLEICDNLTTRFSDKTNPRDPRHRTYIQQLRDHQHNQEDLFDGAHHLHRVAYRLAVSVTGGPPVPADRSSRLRWMFLLRSGLSDATKTAIRQVLKAVLTPNSNIAYATFATRHIPTHSGSFELAPGNSGNPVLQQDANGKTYCQLILDCNDDVPLPDPEPGTEPDPPKADPGVEKPLSVVRRRRAKARKKTTAKKSPKKAAKKSSKRKSTKKVAKKAKRAR